MTRQGEESTGVERVREAFARDPDLAPYADALRVEPGDPWRIGGQVGSVVARRKAVRLARAALPGQPFEDAVRLDPALRRSDASLRAALVDALRSEPAFADVAVLEPGQRPPHHDEHWIAVMVRDGTVFLGGRLDLAGTSLAEGIAWETGACCAVRNLITHAPVEAGPDQALADAARTLLTEHTAVDPDAVEISVERGELELHGRLADPQQREVLVNLCWLLPGVAEVRDRLEPRAA